MNDAEAIEQFLRSTITGARKMPLCDTLPHLRGLLLLAEGRPEIDHLQSVYAQLCTADDQLELIASGQLRLSLGESPRAA